MALFKVGDRYPNYREKFFGGNDIKGTRVYSSGQGSREIGSVHDVLIDETDRICYLVINMGFWIFGKRVLLPIDRCIDHPEQDRIYATNLTEESVERLPEYRDDMVLDLEYEEQVRSVYREPNAEAAAPTEVQAPVEPTSRNAMTDRSTKTDEEPTLDIDHGRLRLYEERLVTDKVRKKTGDVKISKRIETETTDAAVTIQKEIIVIEIQSVQGATRVNTPDGVLQDGEVAHLDLYAEQANIRKEPVVYQEVNIRKETKTDVVTGRETLRREELDIHQDGEQPLVDETAG